MKTLSFLPTGIANVPMVLVGNKLDRSFHRAVSEPDAYEAALSRTAAYVEVSAKNKTNVQDVFTALLIKALIPTTPKDMERRNSRRLIRRQSRSLRRSSSSGSEKSSGSQNRPCHSSTRSLEQAKCILL